MQELRPVIAVTKDEKESSLRLLIRLVNFELGLSLFRPGKDGGG